MTIEEEQLVKNHNLRVPSVRIKNDKHDVHWLGDIIIIVRSVNANIRHFHNEDKHICFYELDGDRRRYRTINQTIIENTRHLADNPWTWLRNRARKKAKWEKKKASTQTCTPKS